MTVPVALIAAVAENGVIGAGNAIPWRLPSDFAFFKRMTIGKPLVMGRKTFESIGRPLPDRVNIVVSRQQGYQPEGVLVINSLAAALDHARAIAKAGGAGEVMVGGGETIYGAAMPVADRLYISHVALAPEGDSYFPEIDPAVWEVIEEPDVPLTGRDSAAFRVRVYGRRGGLVR
ncbi:MAG: dihydrofolate reductase [Devosia sp.]